MRINIEPPGSKTGFQNPGCYAAVDANCSRRLSREHFISAAMLRQVDLNGTAKIAGLQWQARKTFDVIPIGGLASRVLCARHNSALSPLDSVMDALSLTIRKFDHEFRRDKNGTPIEEKFYAGADIERWMLKCLLGMAASGNLSHSNIRSECIDLLLGRMDWPEGWGLYWPTQPSSTVYHSDSFAIETRVNPATRTILMVMFVIRGLPLALCLGKPGCPKSFGVWRPSALVFRKRRREKRLILEWNTKHSSEAIFLDHAGKYDGPPPDWKEWERQG